jgi:glutamine---fructose-6-phosphate transaminase (isomerizing)
MDAPFHELPSIRPAMYHAMQRQPADLRRLLTAGWEQAAQAADLLESAGRVFLAGTGTSYHAAIAGGWLLRAAGYDARPVMSFDLALYPDQLLLGERDAVIVLAHTGETGLSAKAMRVAREAGATVLSVGSLSAVHAGPRLTLRTVETETAATYTASHLAAMTVLAQVATVSGERRDAPGVTGFRAALDELPALVEGVLFRAGEVSDIARMAVRRRVYAIGSGPNEATALEVVIKVREAAFTSIDGVAAEQFLHGPIVALESEDLVIVVEPRGGRCERVREIEAVVAGIGAPMWLIGPESAPEGCSAFPLAELPEEISPLLAVVPMQMLAFEMATLRGTNPDAFRWDDPRYKQAFARLTL